MLTKDLGAVRIRYPDPLIKVNDTVKIELSTGKITEFIRFDTGVIAMATGGRNMGRVGVITHRERHDGGFNIVHIKDAIDNSFATRESNVFVIGSEKPWISLPKGKGVYVDIAFTLLSGIVGLTALLENCPLPRKEIVAERMRSQVTRWMEGRDMNEIDSAVAISFRTTFESLNTKVYNKLFEIHGQWRCSTLT